jgi:hypothetical protein
MPLPASNLPHEAFPQPSDPSTKVWRYLDFAKLVALLIRRELFFARLDQLPDQFEGTLPVRTKEALTELLRTGLAKSGPAQIEKLVDQNLAAYRTQRKLMYVNCWRLGNDESEAMWRVYCPHGPAAAVVLPYEKLRDSLSNPMLFIGQVTYVDYRKHLFDVGNALRVPMHKRIEFSHECEIRVVYWLVPEGNKTETPTFWRMPWAVEDLIESIVIGPYVEPWHRDLIRETVEMLCPRLKGRVHESGMSADAL